MVRNKISTVSKLEWNLKRKSSAEPSVSFAHANPRARKGKRGLASSMEPLERRLLLAAGFSGDPAEMVQAAEAGPNPSRAEAQSSMPSVRFSQAAQTVREDDGNIYVQIDISSTPTTQDI